MRISTAPFDKHFMRAVRGWKMVIFIRSACRMIAGKIKEVKVWSIGLHQRVCAICANMMRIWCIR